MRQTSNGIPILELEETASTNADAMRLGLAGVVMPLWVRADRQSAGRGRSGRPWVSERGNLYASLVLRLDCQPTVIPQLSFVAAVAAIAAIRAAATPETRIAVLKAGGGVSPAAPMLCLKWPNDILIDGAKLVGILPESTIESVDRVLAVIGVGINLATAPDGLGRATTSLAQHGFAIDPEAMLDKLAIAMETTLTAWDGGAGFAGVRSQWLADAGPLGTAMTVNAGHDVVKGTFAGLDADGALILRDHSGYDKRLTFGDVTIDNADNPPKAVEEQT